MKVLYLTTLKSHTSNPELVNTIRDLIKKAGATFLTNVDLFDLVKTKPEEYSYKVDKLKKEAEVIVADTNTESTGIGYEIEWSLSNKKPTILLYNKAYEQSFSVVLQHKNNKLLRKLSYTSNEDLQKTLAKEVKDAKRMLDTKFILIISPEIDRYLEWCADNRRMHKAQVVRNAVEDTMHKDKEYKESAKNL